MTQKTVDIVFDGPPSHDAPRFVEVERDGKSIKYGEWVHRDDGWWVLRVPDGAEIEQLWSDLESVTDERDRLRKLAYDYIEAYERDALLPPRCIVDVWKEALPTKDTAQVRCTECGWQGREGEVLTAFQDRAQHDDCPACRNVDTIETLPENERGENG